MLLSSYVLELHAINGVYGVWYPDDIEIDVACSHSLSFCSLARLHLLFGNRWPLSILLHLTRLSFSASVSLPRFFFSCCCCNRIENYLHRISAISSAVHSVDKHFSNLHWKKKKATKVVSRDINALFALRTLENNNACLRRWKCSKKNDETHTGAFDNEIIRVLCLFVLCLWNALSHTPLRIKFGASVQAAEHQITRAFYLIRKWNEISTNEMNLQFVLFLAVHTA